REERRGVGHGATLTEDRFPRRLITPKIGGNSAARRYDGSVTQTSPVLQQVRALPEKPGVYIMRDARGDVIYIGKARRLRDRVRSYFGSSRSLEPKVRALASQVRAIEHVVTRNEAEALHLEATLVKRHQPIHNVRL